MREAERKYSKTIRYLEHAKSTLDPSLRVAPYLNRAMCKLKGKDYAGAYEDCEAVLTFEPDNVKALYRKC